MPKLYGVGVGPGDPELITVKAARILREADVIAVPDTGGSVKTAQTIASEYIADKEILYCGAPMGADANVTGENYDKAAADITELLHAGKNVAFITLGDPSVYSTYAYVQKRVEALGGETETIPGVPSFCAAAALIGESLCEGAEPLSIIPGSNENLDRYLELPGNKVVMKSGSKLKSLLTRLGSDDRFDISVASNCGMANERVTRGADAGSDNAGYFSIVVLKDKR